MEERRQVLTVTVTVSVPWTQLNVNRLEAAGLEAGRRAMVGLVRQSQELFQRAARARLERREWRAREVATRLGLVRLPVLKVRERATGRTRLLGNDLWGLAARARTTAWVDRAGVTLRVEGLSYRQAAAATGAAVAVRLSAMHVWRRVQAKGRARVGAEAERRRAVAADPHRALAQPPAHLYLEADEIHLAAQRSGVGTHRVKVGISYTGRARVQGRRTARWRLEGKRVYAGVQSFTDFGAGWEAQLEWEHGVSRARAVLFLSDGDPGLRALRARHFPQAIEQLDWAHPFRDVVRIAPDARRQARWIGWLAGGQPKAALAAMGREGRQEPEALAALARLRAVFADGGTAFYGWKRYRRLHDPQGKQRLPRATGGVEKTEEVMIGRAMKRRGMAWTASGANHLVKLIVAWQDSRTWNSLWMESPPLT